MKTKTNKPVIGSTKTISTTITVVTKHFLHGSNIEIIETNTNGKSKFTIERRNDCWAWVVPTDVPIETLHFTEIWNKAKQEFDSIDEIDINRVFYFYTDGHVLFDADFVPVPTVHKFDYIGTPFHNGELNLKKAFEVLKKHPWVVNKKELKIEEIPYYNAEKDCNEFIQVDILPDKKTYTRLYNKVKKNGEYWSVRLKELLHDGYCPDSKHNLLGLLGCVKKKEED